MHLIARFGPGATTLRPFLHKLRGVKIYGTVFIGDDVYLENAHPYCIEIHDEAQIALRTNLIAHFRGSGKIIIGKKVWIGMSCLASMKLRPNRSIELMHSKVIMPGISRLFMAGMSIKINKSN